ncbi:hypothetical protein [Streptomyces sp. B22F1]|uniref:hypothetical protein n=1 Tax=Streptomyces sp. B22F1 TaxID=3153566 RepID=UPI00325CFF49
MRIGVIPGSGCYERPCLACEYCAVASSPRADPRTLDAATSPDMHLAPAGTPLERG